MPINILQNNYYNIFISFSIRLGIIWVMPEIYCWKPLIEAMESIYTRLMIVMVDGCWLLLPLHLFDWTLEIIKLVYYCDWLGEQIVMKRFVA